MYELYNINILILLYNIFYGTYVKKNDLSSMYGNAITNSYLPPK